MIVLKSSRELDLMQDAGRIAYEVHMALRDMIRPGVTTGELNAKADKLIRARGAVPTFKGYQEYPEAICASVNDEVVHGIPGRRVLKEGDVCTIDLGVTYKGYVGDTAYTWPVGNVSPDAAKLLEVTSKALELAIAQCVPGKRVGDIGHAVQTYVEANGLSVVRDYVGHGVGAKMHEDPQVPNYGQPGTGALLRAGMVMAIEPMVNLGTWEVETLADGWTVVTKDGKYSAQFEHSVAVTENGPRILTRP